MHTHQQFRLFIQHSSHLVPTKVRTNIRNSETVPHQKCIQLQPLLQQLRHLQHHLLRLAYLLLLHLRQLVSVENQHTH
jgi:hypothetical protein